MHGRNRSKAGGENSGRLQATALHRAIPKASVTRTPPQTVVVEVIMLMRGSTASRASKAMYCPGPHSQDLPAKQDATAQGGRGELIDGIWLLPAMPMQAVQGWNLRAIGCLGHPKPKCSMQVVRREPMCSSMRDTIYSRRSHVAARAADAAMHCRELSMAAVSAVMLQDHVGRKGLNMRQVIATLEVELL